MFQQTSSSIQYNRWVQPLSMDEPTKFDHTQSEKLLKLLKDNNSFPSKKDSEQREAVLAKLDMIIQNWVNEVSIKNGISEQLAEELGCKLVTFGSYRLGVNGPGADIDTLCIVPRNITREHFFGELYQTLCSCKEVSEITPVPEAYVPLIKMVFDGVELDLLFAQLSLTVIKEDLDILNESNLRNVDDETQRSLNGPRVADEILRIVPNVDTFRTTLRFIKIWAKKRGIYGNAMGYFGGVTYAILVAHICQYYPKALPNVLLHRFFWIYSQWQWPKPVLLKPIDEGSLGLGYRVWNPKFNIADAKHIMPIITPAYPSMNSTHNVSRSTQRIIIEEFKRAFQLASLAEEGKEEWESLIEPTDFFVRYSNYLCVEITAENDKDHKIWVSYLESRLRHLITQLEFIENVQVHAYPYSFKNEQAPKPTEYFYIGLNYAKKSEGAAKVDLSPAVEKFSSYYEWQARNPATMHTPNIIPIKRKDIPEFVISKEKMKQLLKKNKKRKQETAATASAISSSGVANNVDSNEVMESPSKKIKTEDNQGIVLMQGNIASINSSTAPTAQQETTAQPSIPLTSSTITQQAQKKVKKLKSAVASGSAQLEEDDDMLLPSTSDQSNNNSEDQNGQSEMGIRLFG